MARGRALTPTTGPASAVPLAGGYSGETFAVEAFGQQAVLRVYGRHPERAPIDAALLRLVRGLVPVPDVLDVRRGGSQPPHVLTSYVTGTRLDGVLPRAGAAQRAALADSVSAVLTALSGMPFVRPGMFVDADLRLSEATAPADGLVEWLDDHELPGWDAGRRRALRAVCLEADTLLDTVDRTCLVHSDFNPKNLLVDPVTGSVRALLDWEFAHAGSPYTDLGNLLRFERGTDWAHQVLERFVGKTPSLQADPLRLGYASDLWALIELAGRSVRHDVVERADALLRAIAGSGRLDAVAP